MRVAVNVEQLLHEAPGGIGRYTAELVRLLPARGVAVTPFTARHSRAEIDAALRAYDLNARDLNACDLNARDLSARDLSARDLSACDLSAPGLDPVVLPLPAALLYDAWHVLGAAGPVRRVAPVDLVHAPSPAVPPTGSVPLVVTVHDAAPIVMPDAFTRRGVWFHRRGFAMAAKRARLVIAVSEFSADEIAAHTPITREQIRVVPNGVDLEVATPTAVDDVRAHFGIDDQPYVFWAGTFQPRKNVRVLLDAFTRLDPELVPHRLVLAGPRGWKPDDADGEVARSLGDRVRLLGPVDRARVFPLFAGADLFAFPSRHEGFGIPVLEAMAQGTAVVCSDIPALREVAGDAARFVPSDDLDAWVETLRSLLTDPAARAQLVAQGHARVKGYSWARCTDATVAVYEEALGSR